ncbi:MAG TPA: amidohydrolase family protein [Caulobacteraceae bacterium]
MTAYDTIIRNGRVVDGAGGAAVWADVGILDGRIATVGNLRGAHAVEEIDAAGKVVAPGHITQHCHHDATIFWDPYCSDSGEHGVTTILNANCGFSVAPVRAADRERTMLMLSTTEQIPVAQQRIAMPWDWETFPEYLARVAALPKGVNVMTYLPLNPLLIYVMGVDAAKTRRPTAAEIAQMRRLINEAMDLGAVGISMSVMGAGGNSHLDFDGTPMPTDSMHDDDVVEIARAVADRGEGIIQMLSLIAVYGNRALTEKVARMARNSGARVLHNIIMTGEGMDQMVSDEIAWVNRVRAEGLDLTVGTLLHCGWVEATILDLDTAAGQLGGVREIVACRTEDEARALLADPAFVRRFSDEYARVGPSNGSGGVEQQTVISVGDHPELAPLVGRTLADIAAQTGQTVVEALCGIAVKSDLKMQIKSAPFSAMDGAQAVRILRNPGIAAGVSDAGAHTKAFSSGNYATELLIRLVRDQKLMAVEEMHHQLSLKVARTLRLEDRGALLPGFWADILIYDLDALYFDRGQMEIVHDMPGGDWRRRVRSGGYDRILVNGVTTHVGGRTTGAVPGQMPRITRNLGTALAVAAE